MEVAAAARMEKGCLVLVDRDEFARAVRPLKDGDNYEVIVRQVQDKRSAAANRYYFGVVLKMMADESGHTKEELHDEMCNRFLRYQLVLVSPVTGLIEEKEIAGRTSGLTVAQFYRFVEQVIQFAGEFYGLTIPEADKEYKRHRARAYQREKEAA